MGWSGRLDYRSAEAVAVQHATATCINTIPCMFMQLTAQGISSAVQSLSQVLSIHLGCPVHASVSDISTARPLAYICDALRLSPSTS